MALDAPYLRAIQAVPGDTPGEKFRWIAQRIKERLSTCATLEEIVEHEQFARPLAPLVQIEAAKILNRANREEQSNYEAIAEALKSEDSFVVNRALQVTSFFDGTNRNVTNVEYFTQHLFPHVSLNTRNKIVRTLALSLASKNPELAEAFFIAVAQNYGTREALPLLPACRESFAYDKIVERKIALPQKIVKTFFRKNPDFVVEYLRLSKPSEDKNDRFSEWVNIHEYTQFLAKLPKKRLPAFVELIEMHEDNPPRLSLSNKGAEAFLKNGKEHFEKKPNLYIKFLRLKVISAKRMESVFAKLLPKNRKKFDTNAMLKYLKHYPREKTAELLLKSYKEVYQADLVHDACNVTPELLMLLPQEERIKQARIKMGAEQNPPAVKRNFQQAWICYLTPEEVIPRIKEQISQTPADEDRAHLLGHMIYCCKVNNDYAALLEVLKYYNARHRNEQPWFMDRIMDWLWQYFDLSQANEEIWAVLYEAIRRARVKNELSTCNRSTVGILEQNAHYRLLHNLPLDPTIEMIVEMKITRVSGKWNILQKYPEYERKCLDACINLASRLHTSKKEPWTTDKTGILFDILESIHLFNYPNERRKTRVEPMYAKNYPWLLEELERIVLADSKDDNWYIEQIRTMLFKDERDVYERIWTEKKGQPADIRLGAALELLGENPSSVSQRWEEYLAQFDSYAIEGNLRRFLRAIRWYQNIPIKFAERCASQVVQEKKVTPLIVLSHLLHGHSFARFIEPFVPKEKTIDIDTECAKDMYSIVHQLPLCMNNVDPPVPLELVGRMCEGDYLSKALMALTNICRRTTVEKVIAFAKNLASKRVSVRKHAVRTISMVASRAELFDFLLSQWRIEKHYSVKSILFSKIYELFQKEPREDTWLLLKEVIETLTVEDLEALRILTATLDKIPDEYVATQTELLLRTIDRLVENMKKKTDAEAYYNYLISSVNSSICDLLPERFVEELLKRFLFHPSSFLSSRFSDFVTSMYLVPAKEKKLDSRLATFSRIFQEKVKDGWDVPDPQKSRFHPVNHGVHLFFDRLGVFDFESDMDPRLIDGMLQTFLAVLKPQMAATSYLLLIFRKEFLASKTPKEFGEKLAGRLPRLIEIFTSEFLSFLTSILLYFNGFNLDKNYKVEEFNLGVMEGLVEAGSIEGRLIAVRMLSPAISKEYPERYDKLEKLFRKDEHAFVKSVFYHKINKASYADFPLDE